MNKEKMAEADAMIKKLELISKFKIFIFSQRNRSQTLEEIFSKADRALLNQLLNNPVEDKQTWTDFEPSLSHIQTQVMSSEQTVTNPKIEEHKKSDTLNSDSIKKEGIHETRGESVKNQSNLEEENVNNHLFLENNQTDFKSPMDDGSPRKSNIPPEVKNYEEFTSENSISKEKTLDGLNIYQNISKSNFAPNVVIDVLILIGTQRVVDYIKKSFEEPGIRFFDRVEDMRFENPTIIVRLITTRNLDDKLEFAIKSKQPKKSVTMILLGQPSVSISDKPINVPQSKIKINIFTFLYDDQFHEPPFRNEKICETKGVYTISNVLDFIRCEP